jgi:hypothetical protein
MLLGQCDDFLASAQAVSGQQLNSYASCSCSFQDLEKVVCERTECELCTRDERLYELTRMCLLAMIVTPKHGIAQVAANVCRSEET